MEEELFKIDIDGEDEVGPQEKQPEYFVDHFLINEEDGATNESCTESSAVSSEKCWNCDKTGHCLRECPLPIDRVKINQAKKSFNKAQAGSKRYHDNKFAKYRPGFYSKELREALGLRRDELPRHVYMMRELGYPPGWLAEAKITNSGIKMYNDRGKRMPRPGEEDGEIIAKIMKYDVEKLVEIPGFNVPMDQHTREEHRALGFPSMRSEHKLKNFVKYLKEISNKEEDMSDSTDDEVKDMEMSEMLPGEIIEEVRLINRRLQAMEGEHLKDCPEEVMSNKRSKTDQSANPKRARLESKSSSQELEEGEVDDSTTNGSSEDSAQIPKDSGTTPEQKTGMERSSPIDITTNTRGSVASSSNGTPNLKPHSPFSKLPSFENFNKDISDVIDFENLPDSVGKYSSMCSVISKIRDFMTSKLGKTQKKEQ